MKDIKNEFYKNHNKIEIPICFHEDDDGNKVFDLEFSTEKNREIISSNAKGDPTIFKLNINLNYIVFKNDEEIINDEIEKQLTYNNIDDKFELDKYEESIIKNISESLSDEILISILFSLYPKS